MPAINNEPKLIEKLKSINAKGVIYQLPADKTYSVDTPEVEDYIKKLVENFKNTSINVILDLTPNYVTTENELYKLALANETYRNAFVWVERARQPTNWVSKVENISAWKEVKTDTFVLSQFGVNNIDLQLNDPIAKDKFKYVLRKLARLGIKGFRLANAKHYIINKALNEDVPSKVSNMIHSNYGFWTHTDTTFQNGIGDLLHEFWQVVNNETNGEGFLSVTDNIIRPEVFKTSKNEIGFDLPIISALPHTLTENGVNVAKKLRTELTTMVQSLGHSTWAQWPYEKRALDKLNIGVSEYNIFLFLLPGVPVGTLEEFLGDSANVDEIRKLETIRASQSYQHGSFEVYTDLNDTVIAYSRYD